MGICLICSVCKQEKPAEEFPVRNNRPRGRASRCSECTNRIQRERRGANLEKSRAECRGYYQENRELRLQKQHEWKLKNLDRIAEYNRMYRQLKPEVHREHESLRRARLSEVDTERISYQVLLDRDGGICYLCEQEYETLTIDHIVPISRGGTHTYDNVRLACGSCNSRKKDRLVAAGAYAHE